jgi:hypothetical protein
MHFYENFEKKIGKLAGFIAILITNLIAYTISILFTDITFGFALIYSVINSILIYYIILPTLNKFIKK